MNNFNSKIILFGEYGVLKNGKGLAIPFTHFSGSLESKKDNHLNVFSDLYNYIRGFSVLKDELNLEVFSKDIEKGISFNSNIPMGKGLGSSGALCAALYARYSKNFKRKEQYQEDELHLLQSNMALMESFYHGTSSGLDCLISLISKTMMIESRSEIKLLDDINLKGHFALVDSFKARKTSLLVQNFLQIYEDSEENRNKITKFIKLSNESIYTLLEKGAFHISELMEEISEIQLDIFNDMIPTNMRSLWIKGLKSKKYFMKLCGAGGGGFFLVYFPDLASKEEIDFDIIEITR